MVNRNMLLSITVIAILTLSATGAWAGEDTNDGGGTYTLNAGEYELSTDENGFDILQMEGFPLAVLPGNPMLPHKNYDILVPADAIESSIELKIIPSKTSILGGDYKIESASRMLSGTEDWQNDKTVNVYDTDANFPENSVEILPCSQMRKWKFVRIDFAPFQYNPVSEELTLTESVEIEISYSRDRAKSYEKNDMVMADIAPQIFLNYEEARGWYEPEEAIAPQQTHDYVIITTNAIEANSAKLSSFVTHKNIGHSVLVVTEDDFGVLTGQAPDHRAEKIRQWLIYNYIEMGIEYVLLIGDPHPYESGEGDIPMKMCHPEMNQVESPPFDCEPTPTDYFYADLTGNWNIDGDWYYGEWLHDYPVAGGVDFTPEVYVGRIPVYDEEYTTLDNILQKIIDYGTEPEGSVAPGDISWRENILMPMGFQSPDYDGAMLAEQMKDDYLGAAGFSSWRMYQQGTAYPSENSIYASDEELRGSPSTPNVKDRWSTTDFGIVAWWAHGSSASASVGYGGSPSHWDGTLMNSGYCSSLDDDHPAFTYQCSCTNGYPEDSDNLQYAILKNGGIATVSATRPSWFNPGVEYGEFDGSQTNSGIGYEYVDRLVQGISGGGALYQTKQSMTPNHQCYLMNWYDFNLYGDPATSIISSGAGDPNSITNIGLSPPSPAWLDFNEHVDITFDYSTNEAGGVRIFVRPYTDGSLTPNYAATGSPLYPYPGGSGSGYFTITSGDVTVDQLRFQMLNADQSVLLLEFFIDVEYHFGEEPECKVLFDETHSPSGNGPGSFTIEDIFSEWAALLESQGMTVESITTGPITYDVLKNYGVVVIPEPTEDYTDAEINAIKQYVNNGGGLLILGEWGYFATVHGIYPVVNEIAAEFDMVFNDDMVYDSVHNDGNSVWPIIPDFDNSVVGGDVSNVVEYAACSIGSEGSAFPIAWAYDTAYVSSDQAKGAVDGSGAGIEERATENTLLVSMMTETPTTGGIATDGEISGPLVIPSDVTYIDGFNVGGTVSDGISYTADWFALEYTPGISYNIKKVELIAGEGTGEVIIQLRPDAGGLPSDTVLRQTSFTQVNPVSWQGAEFATSYPLTAGTTYWIVFKVVVGSQGSIATSGDLITYVHSSDGSTWSGYYAYSWMAKFYEETGEEGPVVMAASTYGDGRAMAIGDGGLFCTNDPDGDGVISLYEYDNEKLAVNIIDWLCQPVVEQPDLVIEEKWEETAPPQIYLHPFEPMDPREPIKEPVGTVWHELYPVYCPEHHLVDWKDNDDDVLSPCDDIYLVDPKTGEGAWYHVDEMTVTIFVSLPEVDQEPIALEFTGGYDEMERAIYEPVCTYWHEIHPVFCPEYHLKDWDDNDDDYLSYCDWIYLVDLKTGEGDWYHVEEVTWDIIVSPEVFADNTYVVSYTVHNQGDATAPAGHSSTLYIDGVAVEHKVVPVDLEYCETYTDTFRTVVECTPPEDKVTVCADNYDDIDESNEKNNCLTNIWECPELDWGDAPDGMTALGYPTLASSNGARHVIAGPWLGDRTDNPDAEPDGQPDPNAMGDDNDGNDDEDGVVFNTPLVPGKPAKVTVTASGSGLLQGWIDFNADGDWADPNEQIFADQPLVTGTNVLTFNVPSTAAIGRTFARFRFSTVRELPFDGPARDGEVEDYMVRIGTEPICGDVDNDGDIDIDDVVECYILAIVSPGYLWAADVDCDGDVDIDDVVHIYIRAIIDPTHVLHCCPT